MLLLSLLFLLKSVLLFLLCIQFRTIEAAENRLRNVILFGNVNAKEHHTNLFDVNDDKEDLIIRRGQSFHVRLQLSEPYNPSQQDVILQFIFGKNPRLESSSLAVLKLKRSGRFNLRQDTWDASIFNVLNKNDLDVEIFVPASAPVGVWNLRVLISQNGYTRSYRVTNKFYVLFNPWSKLDSVYMPSEPMRQEYVLNDVGKVYMGTFGSPEARDWFYGQFRRGVLQAIMFILDRSHLSPSDRANTIQVSSMLSALVNSHDENGVIYGKWDKPYEPYKAPWEWTGSAAILQMYYESNGRPVRYGQCWVYAAVLTTICRALGLPARPVTNYGSAHDTNKNLAIERYFDSKGEVVSSISRDSIWNFHVWTEVWMNRPDLPRQYNGWQVVDGTPQEPSDGVYRTGPVPVKAIKNGEVKTMYDAPFVYSEVNADVMDYSWDNRSGNYKALKTKYASVGRLIITKKAGNLASSEAEDITSSYKHKEGTNEERQTHYRALSDLGLRTEFYAAHFPRAPVPEDSLFLVSATESESPIGAAFDVILRLINRGRTKRTVELNVNVTSAYYTGNLSVPIKEHRATVVVEPQQNLTFRFTVYPEEYVGKLVDFSILKILSFAKVIETQQVLDNIHDIKLVNPSLRIIAEKVVIHNTPFSFLIEFVNPLRKTLKRCKFNIESRNYGPKEIPVKDIGPHEHFTHVEKAVIRKPGTENFLVTFGCDELTNIQGKLTVVVN